MNFEQSYSLIDRLVHRLAFAGPSAQLVAAEVERALFRKTYEAEPVDDPLFITSLPRAGTTLFLEAFHRLPDCATSLYRDMPFITAPILWNKVTKGFKKKQVRQERAHGDGMMIGYDSPEAFEEILWKLYWEDKYAATRIELWTGDDDDPEFRSKFTEWMQKVICARRRDGASARRFMSKNNANIARIDFLRRLFPRCAIMVPFRHPLDHAASMHRQHRNFLSRQQEEPFARRYMEDVGHYEFGLLHRPLAFDGVEEVQARDNPEALEYWLGYWISAFRHVLKSKDRVSLVCYEKACEDGMATMRTLQARLEFGESSIAEAAALFRQGTRYAKEDEIRNRGLLQEAETLYRELQQHSVL